NQDSLRRRGTNHSDPEKRREEKRGRELISNTLLSLVFSVSLWLVLSGLGAKKRRAATTVRPPASRDCVRTLAVAEPGKQPAAGRRGRCILDHRGAGRSHDHRGGCRCGGGGRLVLGTPDGRGQGGHDDREQEPLHDASS